MTARRRWILTALLLAAASAAGAAPETPVVASSTGPATRPVTIPAPRGRFNHTPPGPHRPGYLGRWLRSTDVPAPVVSTTPIGCEPAPPFDVFHEKLSTAFVAPIAWFDSLFFTERDEIETNQSYLRLIAGPQWVDGEGVKIRQAVRVKLRVPGLQQRLHLLFSDEEEDETEEAVLDRNASLSRGSPISPINRRTNDTRYHPRAGLGYQIIRLIDTNIDVETSLQSHARGELDVIARHRLPTFFGVKQKLILDGFWLQRTGFGSSGRLDMERPLSKKALLHFDNGVTQIHNVNGVVGDSRLSLEQQLSNTAGLSPGVGFRGETSPRWRASAFYFSVVYRQQFFRDWLFYELEPGENWNRNTEGAFPPQPFVALRLEAQFRESSP